MLIDFLGKQISVKEFDCYWGNIVPQRITPSVNLFVKVTNGCNSRCSFCSNAEVPVANRHFNINKLFDIIHELRHHNIIVNRINITGGEPSVVPSLVTKIVERVQNERIDDVHLHLNTNGLLPESQFLMRLSRWDSISVSLHHYDMILLSKIYGCDIPSSALHFDGIDKQRVNLSCNLIKGYIDNSAEAHRMLDFTLELGIPRIGFVALMKINDYCREHFVDLEEIHIEDIPHVYFTKSMNRGTNCKCSNYLYNHNLSILEIYMRNYSRPDYCESSLVYDGEYLRQGFYSDNIIY